MNKIKKLIVYHYKKKNQMKIIKAFYKKIFNNNKTPNKIFSKKGLKILMEI